MSAGALQIPSAAPQANGATSRRGGGAGFISEFLRRSTLGRIGFVLTLFLILVALSFHRGRSAQSRGPRFCPIVSRVLLRPTRWAPTTRPRHSLSRNVLGAQYLDDGRRQCSFAAQASLGFFSVRSPDISAAGGVASST